MILPFFLRFHHSALLIVFSDHFVFPVAFPPSLRRFSSQGWEATKLHPIFPILQDHFAVRRRTVSSIRRQAWGSAAVTAGLKSSLNSVEPAPMVSCNASWGWEW